MAIGVGIIGAGGIALANHIPGFALCPDTKVVALCDASREALEKARAQVEHFQKQDLPHFSRWLHSRFGTLLTELRETSQRVQDLQLLLIEVENEIFKAGACEAHNCGSNNYLIFVDLQKDNINVFHIEDSGKKHYFENGEIKLPAKFAEDLNG